jgi:hypothetical protein
MCNAQKRKEVQMPKKLLYEKSVKKVKWEDINQG